MSLQTIEINSVKITFDKDKTKEYRTDFNKPCDCQNCRNYYKHIENNPELVEFLSEFGIDYNCTEEVFSWDLGDDKDSLMHHEGYYGVFGKIEGEEFDFEKFGVKITFQKGASVPCDRTGEYFWLCIEGEFPYILDEERDLPAAFSQGGNMKFLFNVNIDDQDYFEYNNFWLTRSYYGKKQFKTSRIVISVIFAIFFILSLLVDGFSVESVLGIIPMVIIFALFQILLTKFLTWSSKLYIKALKKSGKMGYSPESVIEFYEDRFVETTFENKTECKYSVIERISVVDNKTIYIHVNNVMAYILPLSCFDSKEQYDSFFEFIKTKCGNVDTF